MANSKFSGVAFLTGANATANSSFAGIESTGPGTWENRRWTLAELAAGLPAANLQSVLNDNNIADGNGGNVGTIVLTDTVTAETATYSNTTIQTNCSFDIDVNQPNKSFDVSTSDGNIQFVVGGVGKRLIFNTPEIDLTTASFLDSTGQPGLNGQVLSSLGAGSGTQWTTAGGTTPDIQTVVNAGANSVINDQGGNRSFIDFREGNTTSQFSVGKDPGGNFGIRVGQGNFSLQGAVFQSIFLQTGSSTQKRFSLIDSASGNATAELTSAMDLRLSSTSAFKCGGLASPGTSGQVLTSTGTSVEWTTPSAPNVELILLPDTPDQNIYNDGNIYIKLNDASTDDIQAEVLTNPSSGDVTFTWESAGGSPTSGGTALNTGDAITTLNGNFGDYDKMSLTVYAPGDTSYPYYEFLFTKGAAGTNFVTRVNKWDSIS